MSIKMWKTEDGKAFSREIVDGEDFGWEEILTESDDWIPSEWAVQYEAPFQISKAFWSEKSVQLDNANPADFKRLSRDQKEKKIIVETFNTLKMNNGTPKPISRIEYVYNKSGYLQKEFHYVFRDGAWRISAEHEIWYVRPGILKKRLVYEMLAGSDFANDRDFTLYEYTFH